MKLSDGRELNKSLIIHYDDNIYKTSIYTLIQIINIEVFPEVILESINIPNLSRFELNFNYSSFIKWMNNKNIENIYSYIEDNLIFKKLISYLNDINIQLSLNHFSIHRLIYKELTKKKYITNFKDYEVQDGNICLSFMLRSINFLRAYKI
jgi:hypothetical protein